jgi:hypothetical protein
MPDIPKDEAAPWSLNSALNAWNGATGNSPLVQGLALGLPTYFLTKWLGQKAEWEYAQRAAEAIDDPEERAKFLADSYNGKASGRLAAILGSGVGLSPLLFNTGNIVNSLKSDNPLGNLGKSVLSYAPVDSWSFGGSKAPAAPPKEGKTPGIEKNEAEIEKLADYYMRDPYPTERRSASDMTLGRSFVMPIIRPPMFLHEQDIPQHNSMELLATQQPVLGGHLTHTLTNGLANAEPGGSGMISTSDIFHGLVGAGVGAAAGWGLAHVMGTIFAQPPALKNKMAQYGAIGGAILNSGLVPKAAGYLLK